LLNPITLLLQRVDIHSIGSFDFIKVLQFCLGSKKILIISNIYVEGQVHTNTIENFWSVLKRGLYGVYHQVSDKHISRYLDEYAARFNNRSKTSDERFHQFLEGSESVLTYKKLTSK